MTVLLSIPRASSAFVTFPMESSSADIIAESTIKLHPLWLQLDDLDFADDLALLFHSHQQMQKTSEPTAISS